MKIQDKFDLTGRTAIVTGGAGLLGVEFCRTLAEAGAAVAVVDLNAEKCAAVAEDLTRAGYSVLSAPTDITRPESVQAMIEKVLAAFGRIDILVNSAALDPKFDPEALAKGITPGRFEDYPLEQWNAALNVNLTGTFLVTQAVARQMVAQGKKGSIINICSTYGLNGPDQRIYRKADGSQPAYKPIYYTVTKAGMVGFTKYLAAYYMGTEIRVNMLTPGGVYNNHDETFVQNYAAKTILGRMARKDEMNGALLFLASDASSYMTGSNVVVDGGWTAW
ncbi:MAG: SDR family oxidoreductase [Anaerolineales bacterium]|nr:SDR family oxidoreductase [Anaerolineales bacterium]MCX7754481.1 SDR family oxidoreductase [Anaerolineales bacterium]MDW8277103.1 SDR family oxidoreductase [Anaerolineales bacterium]